ncbi:MAG: hypothetical protein V7736_08510 [Colwellia polaris]|jgi:hypothetical protein|uniref:hypothetical protein n=1 Tax=Colwellia polaris TaxID=326537 RepID=UPI000A17160F|nr:hypothetical protein [Colwellia polaris]
MNKEEYLASCKTQLLTIFKLAKNHQKDDQQKFRTEGFIQAGKVLGIISHKNAADLMEEAHFEVFNESIAARKKRKANLKQAIEKGDDSYINIPALERLKR